MLLSACQFNGIELVLILSRSDDFLRIVQSRDSRVRYRNGQLQIDDVCRHQLVIADDVGFAEALDRVLFGDINGVCVSDVVEIVRINHPGRYQQPPEEGLRIYLW